MYKGTLPDLDSGISSGYRRAEWSRADLECGSRSSRRQWLYALGGLCLGAAAAPLVGLGDRAVAAGSTSTTTSPSAEPGPESDQFLALLDAPPATLIRNAGLLEREAVGGRRHELIPVAERLLGMVLEDPGHPQADMAGACAVRILGQLGRLDLISLRAGAIIRHPDLEETSAAAASFLKHMPQHR